MTDFTEIDGIGPSRAETFAEDYDDFEDLAEADPDVIAEYDYVSHDKALSIVAQAGDIVEEREESDESEDDGEDDVLPSDIEDLATEDDAEFVEDESDSVEDEPVGGDEDSSEPDTTSVTFEFNALQYDLVVTALVQDVSSVYNSNPPRREAGMALLEQMRSQQDGVVEFDELSEQEINTLHSAVRQLRNHYQGTNVIEFMNELFDVEDAVDDARDSF